MRWSLALFALLSTTVLLLNGAAQKVELGPAVSTHCTQTILQLWHFTDDDWDRLSDQQLEDLGDELTDKCRPAQGSPDNVTNVTESAEWKGLVVQP